MYIAGDTIKYAVWWIPRKTKKLNKRKDKIEACMTDEILATVEQNNKI